MYIFGGSTKPSFSSVNINFVEIFDGSNVVMAKGRSLLPYASGPLLNDACLIPTKDSNGFIVTGGSVWVE